MKFRDFSKSNGGANSKHFVRLEDGKSITGVFRGNPFEFYQHWQNNRSTLCVGRATCPLCKDDKASFRFRINFVTSENGAHVAKIFEQGVKVYKKLAALHGADYDLEKTTVRITRSGSGKSDTEYEIVPVKGGELTPGAEKKIAAIALHNLDNTPSEEGEETTDAAVNEEEAPF